MVKKTVLGLLNLAYAYIINYGFYHCIIKPTISNIKHFLNYIYAILTTLT